MRQPLTRLGPLLAALLVLSACSPFGDARSEVVPTAGSTTPVVGDVSSRQPTPVATAPTEAPSRIVEGGLDEPRNLNPVLVADPISEQLSHLVFNGLVFVDPGSGQPRGDLATTWDISQDRKTYTFHLRDGVRWHDGQPFTARDVVFTYSLMMNKQARSPRYSRLVERVREVRAPTGSTVVIALIAPDASFMTTLATLGIVPEHLLSSLLPEELVTDPFGLSSAVGTGPFTLQRWVHGDQLIFARNPDYFRGPAAYEQYVYRIVATPDDIVAGLADGSIDWAQLEPGVVGKARDNDRVRLVSLPGYDLSLVALQLDPAKSTLFLDPKLRQALMLALDRDRLVADVWQGTARLAEGTIPPASSAFVKSQTSHAQNLNEAKRLLQEAGWVTGDDGIRARNGVRLRFKLLTNGDNTERRRTVDWLIERWRAIGVEAVPEFDKWSTVRQRATQTRDFEAVVIGFRADLDPDSSALWSSDSFFDAFNLGHYANAEVDRLLEQALAESDAGKRKEQYARVQEIVMRELPVLPLVFPNVTVGLSTRLQDTGVTAILVRNRANIEQWVPRTGG